MQTIKIAIPSDANYVDGLLVTAGSIALHASRDVKLEIIVLDGGVTSEQYRYIASRLELLHPHVSLVSARITTETFSRFPEWHGNRMAYARFLIPDLMPSSDYVIYTDSDMLWKIDVAELWRQRRPDMTLLAVHDPKAAGAGARAWQERYGFEFHPDSYFCGGLQFMNLTLFRERDYMRRAFDALRKYPGARFADQDALNLVIGTDVSLLDNCWMRFSYDVGKTELANPVVIHYSNELPWKRSRRCQAITNPILEWHRINGRIRGISTWKSLRIYFGGIEIVLRRMLYYFSTIPMVRTVFFSCLRITGRSSDVRSLKHWCHVR